MRGNFTNHPGVMVPLVCVCGIPYTTTQRRLDMGRGRFCSNGCRYKNASRPRGLTYVLKVPNPTSFRPGVEQPKGPDSPSWRGDDVHYKRLHRWLAQSKVKPDKCEKCGADGPLDWANISHEYRRDLNDWMALCRLCHRNHDSGEARGMATARFGVLQVQRGY